MKRTSEISSNIKPVVFSIIKSKSQKDIKNENFFAQKNSLISGSDNGKGLNPVVSEDLCLLLTPPIIQTSPNIIRIQRKNRNDPFRGKWPSLIKLAKKNWNKLSHSELIQVEGHENKLVELIQNRYEIPLDTAIKQVNSFIEQCNK